MLTQELFVTSGVFIFLMGKSSLVILLEFVKVTTDELLFCDLYNFHIKLQILCVSDGPTDGIQKYFLSITHNEIK